MILGRFCFSKDKLCFILLSFQAMCFTWMTFQYFLFFRSLLINSKIIYINLTNPHIENSFTVEPSLITPAGYTYDSLMKTSTNEHGNESSQMSMLILVISGIPKFHLRQAIRESWGEAVNMKKYNARIAFIVGTTTNESRNEALKDEMNTYGDIEQVNVHDVYYNLSLKGLEAYRWAYEHYPNTTYILKQDDDAYVNLALLVQHLHKFERANHTEFIAGYYFPHRHPKRDNRTGYFTPVSVWANKTWPPTLTGPAYVFTTNIIPKLLETAGSPHIKLVNWEDIYITGVLRHFAKIPIYSIPHMTHISCKQGSITTKGHVSYHRVNATEHALLYRKGKCGHKVVRKGPSKRSHLPPRNDTSIKVKRRIKAPSKRLNSTHDGTSTKVKRRYDY